MGTRKIYPSKSPSQIPSCCIFSPVNYPQVTSLNILSNIKQEKIDSVTVLLYYRQIKSKGCLYGRTNLGIKEIFRFKTVMFPLVDWL